MACISLKYPNTNEKQTVNIDLEQNVLQLKNIANFNNDWSKFGNVCSSDYYKKYY